MTARVDVQVRSLRLTDQIKSHVEGRAGKLDHYLPMIEEVAVELTHHPSARSANDRNVAQITARGKALLLRAEVRAAEVLTAFELGSRRPTEANRALQGPALPRARHR